MWNIFSIAFFLALLFITLEANAIESRISWTTVKDQRSLDEIIQNSVSQGKSSVLYFSVDWSVDANRTEKNLWIPKKGHEHFNFIKVDLSAWDEESKLLIAHYNLSQETYTPVLMMLDQKGQEVEASRIVGPKILTINAFVLWLREGHLSLTSSSPTIGHVTIVRTESGGKPKNDDIDSVFRYKVSHEESTIIADFTISPNYYLYKDKFKIAINGNVSPSADLHFAGTPVQHADAAWGSKEVFEDNVKIELDLGRNNFLICNPEAANQIALYYQGSSKSGKFYPPQKRTVQFEVRC